MLNNNTSSELWNAANIFLARWSIEPTGGYILPLLFFKRVSEVWDEEQGRMLEEYGEEFPDEHRFQVSDGCHRGDVRSTTQNVGATLKHVMQEIEKTMGYGFSGDLDKSAKAGASWGLDACDGIPKWRS
jgi:type I restriction enzyme M protein